MTAYAALMTSAVAHLPRWSTHPANDGGSGRACEVANAADWRAVDRELRSIAVRRSALDAEEARWLREAERLQIWRPLGMVSALDYMERVLGYAPHTAHERLRVARALGDLPQLDAAFARGDFAFSAIRELTRVATPETEAAWRDGARGMTVRQVEELVAGHQAGDRPDDPPNPELVRRTIRFDVLPETYARLRQVQAALADEHGGQLDPDQLVTALCDAVLERAPAGGEPSGRAKFQIATVVCARCDQGWQDGAGVRVPIDEAAVERARCDAQHLGSLDADEPARAAQDIPPAVVRLVWRRDGGRCQTPGCRSARGLEIHHVVRRVDGGTHEASNLRLQCSSCHLAVHRGTLELSEGGGAVRPQAPATAEPMVHAVPGDTIAHQPQAPATPPDAIHTPNGERDSILGTRDHDPPADRAHAPAGASHPTPPHATLAAGSPRLVDSIVRAQARDALVGLGWTPLIARRAVDEAMAHVGPNVRLETVIREALRRCPRPAAC